VGRNKLRMSFDIQSVPTNQNLEIDSTIDFFFLIKHLLLVTELDREILDFLILLMQVSNQLNFCAKNPDEMYD